MMRKIEERVFLVLMVLSTLVIVGSLAAILGVVISRGLPALSWSMITQTSAGGYYLGREGGILNAILGSLCLAGAATLIALFFSLAIGLFLQSEYVGRTRLAPIIRFSLDVLWGVPSIVYGAFGFTLMVYFGLRASLLGGIITLTLVILPMMARAMDEVIRMTPDEIRSGAYALGANRLETSLRVVLRQALPGICTAVILAFGRAIGCGASVLLTAGYTDALPSSLVRPVASLPLAVFFQLSTPFPEVQQRAYAAALILTLMVLVLSLIGRLVTAFFSRHISR